MRHMRRQSESVVQLQQRRLLRSALRVGLVLICAVILVPIVQLIVEPFMRAGAAGDQSSVAIAGQEGSPATVALDVAVDPARPAGTVFLNGIHAAGMGERDACPTAFALATGRQVILPHTQPPGGLPAPVEPLTLTGGIPISGTTGFLVPPGMDTADTWWAYSALPGFVAECEAEAGPDAPDLSLTGGQAVSDPDLAPLAARTMAQPLRSAYSYPFDRYQLLLSAALFEEESPVLSRAGADDLADASDAPIAVYRPVAETALVPSLQIAVSAPGWEVSERPVRVGDGTLEVRAIVLERPFATRVLAVVFLLVLLVITCFIPFIADTSSVIEILVTIFVSLWGVRAVLIPDYITFPTVVDHAIVVLYILLTFALFLRFAVLPAWHWLDFGPDRGEE